jgi:hypothetical protein
MASRKITFGILIIFGFALITGIYLIVMSSIPEVHGTVQVNSKIVSWKDNPPGPEDNEMVSVNGYCIKGPRDDSRLLLSTSNTNNTSSMKYAFPATVGKQHLIVVYLQMDHLTGDVGQIDELQFKTKTIQSTKQSYDFHLSFECIKGINTVTITVKGTEYQKSKVFTYPISRIPDIIKL